jgi:phosphocarrier protein HPr
MVKKEVTIKNRAGIHARPAALIVKVASKFSSQIFIEKGSEKINAKSIMGIITLGAGYNTVINITADGDDQDAALSAMVELVENRFEE